MPNLPECMFKLFDVNTESFIQFIKSELSENNSLSEEEIFNTINKDSSEEPEIKTEKLSLIFSNPGYCDEENISIKRFFITGSIPDIENAVEKIKLLKDIDYSYITYTWKKEMEKS